MRARPAATPVEDPAQHPGGTYRHTDTLPGPGDWYYWLVRVDQSGGEEASGPVYVSALPESPHTYTYLPAVWR